MAKREKKSKPEKKSPKAELKAQASTARAELEALGIPAEIVKRLKDAEAVATAAALRNSSERVRESMPLIDGIALQVERVKSAKVDEADAKAAAKDARDHLEATQDRLYTMAAELAQVGKPGHQGTLPFQVLQPAEQPGTLAPGATVTVTSETIPDGPKPEPRVELAEDLDKVIASLRKGYGDNRETRGIGPTGLARRLFGQATADMKGSALALLEQAEKAGRVVRVEGANKEPSFYPVDPGESASAGSF